MKKLTTKEITRLAMLSAISIVLGIIPNIGIIQIGPVALTILHIPVIIAAIMDGIVGGTLLGLVFGLTSWFVAATRGITPLDLLFINPLVSVLPRIVFGLVAGILSKLLIKDNSKAIMNGVMGFISTFIHTILVYICLFFFAKDLVINNIQIDGTIVTLFKFIISIFTLNALLEASLAALISYLLDKVIKVSKKRH